MREFFEAEMEGKKVKLFKCGENSAPIIYANMYKDEAADILSECEKLTGKPFHFVSITGLRWNEELSPWRHASIISQNDNFTGEAEKYMRCLEEKIISFAEEKITPDFRVISGYSMGGLFALYAPYISDKFSRAVSASGSVWYPGFVAYVKEHDLTRIPDAVYLSLGDKEKRSKNRYLSAVETSTVELYSVYKSRSIDAVFELNPGNHFNDAALRLAKGIAWSLKI